MRKLLIAGYDGCDKGEILHVRHAGGCMLWLAPNLNLGDLPKDKLFPTCNPSLDIQASPGGSHDPLAALHRRKQRPNDQTQA